MGGQLRVGVHELRAGRLALQEPDRLLDPVARGGGFAEVPQQAGQSHHGLAGPDTVAGLPQGGDRSLEGRPRLLEVTGLPGRSAPASEPRPLRVVHWAQLQRPLVERSPRQDRIQAGRAVAGQRQETAGGRLHLDHLGWRSAQGPGQGERLHVVMGEQLGLIGHPVAGHPLEPLGGRRCRRARAARGICA